MFPIRFKTLEPKRSGRTVRQPDKLMFLGETYEVIQEEQDPNTYKEAQVDIDASHWQITMKAKIESIYSN